MTSKLDDFNRPRFLRDGSDTGFSPLSKRVCKRTPSHTPTKRECMACPLYGKVTDPHSAMRGKRVDCHGKEL